MKIPLVCPGPASADHLGLFQREVKFRKQEWPSILIVRSPGCQEQETWKQFSEYRYLMWANAWPVMICTLSM